MVIVVLIIGITLIDCSSYPGFFMNPIDLKPNYNGSIMSIGSWIPQIATILTPYLIGNFIPRRWVFTILASTGFVLQSLFSVILSMTIIYMVVPIESSEEQDNNSCPSGHDVTIANRTSSISQKENETSIERYSWDEYTQGIILSSFSWTSTITAFFYGTLAERFGAKYIFGLAVLAQASLTLSTPFLINLGGSTALIVTRALIGLGTDGLYSVISTMIPHWTTAVDRSKIGAIIYTGNTLGLFFGNVIPALIIKYSGMGWPAVFYFFGILGLIWFTLWITFVYETPTVHPFISEKELEHLRRNSIVRDVKRPTAPWKHIIRCKAFWAFAIIYNGSDWAVYVMLSGLPRYLGNVVKFPIESNGYYSAMPYVLMWITAMGSVWISDKILEKQWLSVTNTRKIFSTTAVIGPTIFFLLASYAECNKTAVVVMFIMGNSLIGSFSSLMMNPVDLSPNYAGTIMSVASGLGQVAGMFAPYLIGMLVPNSTIVEWRTVFWIVFSLGCCANAVYVLWFKAEVQPWNDEEFTKDKMKCVEAKEEVESMLMS